MAIENQQTEETFAGTGTATPLNIPFQFVDDLEVWRLAPGAEPEMLVKGRDYTVTGGSFANGVVTPLSAIPVGTSWRVRRSTRPLQPTRFTEGGDLPAKRLEGGLDRTTMVAQEIQRDLTRALRLPDGEGSIEPLPPAAGRRSTAVGFDAFGAQTLLPFFAGSVVPGADTVYVNQPASGGIARLLSDKLRDVFSVRDFGARGDGETDDASAFQRAIDNAVQTGTRYVYVPPGRYYLGAQIILHFGVALVGPPTNRRGKPGNWINAGADGVTPMGADIFTDVGRGSTNAADAFIEMRPDSRLENLNFWYVGQTRIDDPATIVTYAPTISVASSIDGNADNVVIRNCSALNSYEFLRLGDGLNPVGRLIASDIFINVFGPVAIRCATISGDVPMFARVFIQNYFTTDPTYRPGLNNYFRNTTVGFDLGFSQGVNLTDCIVLACRTGVKCTKDTWAQIQNCLFDYCLLPADLEGGADRVCFSNCTFIKNFGTGHCVRVGGQVNHLAFTNCVFGDAYSGQKTGVWCSHNAGTVKVVGCTFTASFPAVLNTANGAVQISASGIGYNRVTGANISVDGGPALVPGQSLGLANVTPAAPALSGWTYVNPANVTAIGGGVKIQGAGNNSLTYRPSTISAENGRLIYFGVHMYALMFDYRVNHQAGSPRLNLLVLDDADGMAADAFQVSQDAISSDSGLPEGEWLRICLVLPWGDAATKIRFDLQGQSAATSHEIANVDIRQIAMSRGHTGLEFFHGKTMAPLGCFDAHTGGRVWRYIAPPIAGTWSTNDRVNNLTPTAGQPSGWICSASGSPGTWLALPPLA